MATVVADELRTAATRPMISPIGGVDDGRLRVCETVLTPVAEIPAPPSPTSLLGGTDLTLPPSPVNPYASVLADIDQGGSKGRVGLVGDGDGGRTVGPATKEDLRCAA